MIKTHQKLLMIAGLWILSCTLFAAESKSLQKAIDLFYQNNIESAYPLFEKLAKQNNSEAHYYLGLIYNNKRFKKYNPNLAIEQFHIAADLKNAQAMQQLGMLYDNGIGVKQDALKALDWYRAARKYQKSDNSTLAFLQENAQGLNPISYADLFRDLLDKAKDGDAQAQYQLAENYDEGKLVDADFEKALHWYELAANNGHPEARFMMGYFYCRGMGVDKDIEFANKWLQTSGYQTLCVE